MSEFPAHIQRIIENRKDIERLLEIHKKTAGDTPGKKHNVEVLNKSAITLLVGCWEAYVEDVADAAFEVLVRNVDGPHALPRKVLAMASKDLRNADDETKVWTLAQDGWRDVLEKHRDAIKERHTGRVNTPRPNQVDNLFENLIGLRAVSKSWKWTGASNRNVIDRLDRLITLRGEIAHRVTASEPVHKDHVAQSLNFIGYLSVKLSNQVRQHVGQITGEEPWTSMRYGSVT